MENIFRRIGLSEEFVIVGEVGQAHDGSINLAHSFIDAIAASGANAVKFQTHIADAESTPGEPWRVKFSVQDASRYAYWKRMEFTSDQWAGLKSHAEEKGLLFLSSPFSTEAVHLLDKIGIKAWKLASGEMSNRPLFDEIAKTGKPVILSSGMSDLQELDDAVSYFRRKNIFHAVLQCTSSYPCPPEKVGINLIPFFRDRYDCPVGLSDHSGTVYPSLAAATLGADIVEVHVTLSRAMFGPDVPASVTLRQLKQLVEGFRFIRTMLHNPVDKDEVFREMGEMRNLFGKSIYASSEIPAGTRLNQAHLAVKKPGNGIPAKKYECILGKTLLRSYRKNEMLNMDDLE